MTLQRSWCEGSVVAKDLHVKVFEKGMKGIASTKEFSKNTYSALLVFAAVLDCSMWAWSVVASAGPGTPTINTTSRVQTALASLPLFPSPSFLDNFNWIGPATGPQSVGGTVLTMVVLECELPSHRAQCVLRAINHSPSSSCSISLLLFLSSFSFSHFSSFPLACCNRSCWKSQSVRSLVKRSRWIATVHRTQHHQPEGIALLNELFLPTFADAT